MRMRVRVKALLGLLVLSVIGAGALLYLPGHTSRSTLPWKTLPEMTDRERQTRMREICGEPNPLYFPSALQWPFPALSPDGRYYVDLADAPFGRPKVMMLFQADTDQPIGRYVSAYSELKVYCWAEDSTGVYVADYDPGSSSLFIPFNRPEKTGPVKKLLVPWAVDISR